MKLIISFIISFLLVFGLLTIFLYEEETKMEEEESVNEETSSSSKEEESKEENETTSIDEPIIDEAGLHDWIGKSEEDIIEQFGEPERIDLSPYGYEWLIYNDDTYLQIAILDDEVVSIFTNYHDLDNGSIEIGQDYEEVDDIFSFHEHVSLSGSYSSYQFELTSQELNMRPLAKINEEIYVQFYFDTIEEELSSIRYITPELLLLHRPYSIVYRGELPEPVELTDDEWTRVQEGQAKQIYDITNVIRSRHGLSELEWDEETAYVAYLHSEDMEQNEYFSHTSPEAGELNDRLEAEDIYYQLAAENIAAKYVDGIAAVEGWLNSEGHRVNLLNDEFTHLGVGVYRDYYTQNFITPW
ncbi:CAP domain-containing protein [Evansella halocellulosilytica]|uniref:CAP domain-containing protein n=1 Tax=Evansella halocellulosilytica TaxID=2011013 RepID=UPI000BB71BAA|nr:CAP domain-containing protein [Evansella halocellulosilytica]